MTSYNVGLLPGDGIGPEVTREGLKVLKAVAELEGAQVNLVDYPYSGEYYLKTKELVPDSVIDEWRTLDAVLLGAIGHPDVEEGLVERSVILGLRFGLDLYVNLRPIKLYSEHLCPLKDKGPEDIDIAARIAEALDLVGLVAVEMFVARDGAVLVNEIAPRPHNSGHWTLDACATSQFAQLVRAICGLPLGSPERHCDAVMKNLVGHAVDAWPDLLAEPGARLHLYGKTAVRPGRKMGHVTRLTPLSD